jgi:hypothetical protein
MYGSQILDITGAGVSIASLTPEQAEELPSVFEITSFQLITTTVINVVITLKDNPNIIKTQQNKIQEQLDKTQDKLDKITVAFETDKIDDLDEVIKILALLRSMIATIKIHQPNSSTYAYLSTTFTDTDLEEFFRKSQEIIQKAELYEKLINTSPNPVIILECQPDNEKKKITASVITANQAAKDQLNANVNGRLREIFKNNQEMINAMTEVYKSGKAQRCQATNSEELKNLEIHFLPLTDGNLATKKYIALMVRPDTKALQIAAMKETVGGLSHKMRQALQVILNAVDIDDISIDQVRVKFALIEEQVKILVDLLKNANDLNDFVTTDYTLGSGLQIIDLDKE